MAEIFDVVELLSGIPEEGLSAGMQGTIVECHASNAYEVEFVNEMGETLALLTLTPEQFAVVWRARTRSWLPIPEQIAAVVADLPAAAGYEVLDFARFLRARQKRPHSDALVENPVLAQSAQMA
jgi:hypothetical protein